MLLMDWYAMPEHNPQRTMNRFLLAIVVFLGGAVLKLAAPVFIALLLTVLLVYVIDPLVIFLQRRRVPLWLSILISVIFFFALFFGLGLLVFYDLAHFGKTFSRFQEQIVLRAQAALENLERSLGLEIAVNPFEELRTLPISSLVLSNARSVFRFLSEFLLIFFFAIILLAGKYRVIRMVLTVFPRRHSMVPIMLKHVDRHLRMYLGIKTLSSIAIGIGTMGILLAFRVEFAVTWGFLTILLNFIPALGPITAVILPVLISVVQHNTLLIPIAVAASLTALHLGISNFVEPRFLGERLNLSFFVIFLSLFFWGWMWGAAGVLLAVPVTASIKIILERIPVTSRFALLLGRTGRQKPRRVDPRR
jgi:AI-2 transport protein TqsA